MQIDFHNKSSNTPEKDNAVNIHLKARWIVCIILVLTGASYYLGAYTNIRESIDEAITKYNILKPSMMKNFIAGKLSDPEQMIIDIKQKNFDKIKYKRYEALQRNLIITDEDSYVPASISIGGNSYKVELRLKGDYTDHLEGNKWSFRIKVKGDHTIWGMKRFSIQAPERSGYIKEWILHQFLKYEDLIGLRYDFIDVVLNGKNLGIFALEESFSKELIESNHRREGPILKFDESDFILSTRKKQIPSEKKTNMESDYYLNSDILSFRTEKTLSNETLKNNFMVGRSLLNKLRNHEITLPEAVDVKKAARVFSILTIMSVYHAVRWKNVRFYFNPVTQKLELIAYNGYGPGLGIAGFTTTIYESWLHGIELTPEWYGLFFSDREFLRDYFAEMKRMTAPGYLEKFFQTISPELEKNQNILFKDGPLEPSPVEIYFYNRDQIRKLFAFKPKLKAYLDRDNSKGHTLHINVAANAPLPMQLHSIRCKHTNNIYTVDGFTYGRYYMQLLKLMPITITDLKVEDIKSCVKSEKMGKADNLVLDGMQLEYSVLGVKKHEFVDIDAYPIDMSRQAIPSEEDMNKVLEDFVKEGVISIDHKSGTISFLPGKHRIQYDLYIPSGYMLQGSPGTAIALDNGAAIISLSPVRLLGSKESPFIITSLDKTGQGLFVMSAKQDSVLDNVHIDNVVNINRDGWVLSGAVTFYESDVIIKDSVIENTIAEDSLNIVRSKFAINKTEFHNSKSDALDVDFGSGLISEATFTDCNNDCIDVSGTIAAIVDVNINKTSDKGVSVGEKSDIKIVNTNIGNANIGVASKDGSVTHLKNVHIVDSSTGLAAYRKKPEYPGATITGERVVIENTDKPQVKDELSSIEIK